jgi:NTP-dependent ternary system trypsin peptidase co-occuring protein
MSEFVLLKVPVGDGTDDVIEVEVSRYEVEGLKDSGVVLAASDSDRFEATAFSLTSAVEHVLPALRTVVDRLRGGLHAPDEVTLQIGLQIGGEAGFVFAKGTAEANIALTMTWRSETDKTAAAAQDLPSAGVLQSDSSEARSG